MDRYDLACRPVSDLLVDYLRERQPRIDHITLIGLVTALVRVSGKTSRPTIRVLTRCDCRPTSPPGGRNASRPRPSANSKLAQADATAARRSEAIDLGIPAYRDIAAATITAPRRPP
ncbi:MAG: hypothetical protein ACM3ML_00135 [Micromonosporaceae bacterium]